MIYCTEIKDNMYTIYNSKEKSYKDMSKDEVLELAKTNKALGISKNIIKVTDILKTVKRWALFNVLDKELKGEDINDVLGYSDDYVFSLDVDRICLESEVDEYIEIQLGRIVLKEYRGTSDSPLIPEFVYALDSDCFCGKNIKSIIIPNNIEIIGTSCFFNCEKLQEVVLPNNLKHLGSKVFAYCSSLRKIDIPSSIDAIRANSFYYCTNLESINIQYGIEYLGEDLFEECLSLKSVVIPDSVKSSGGIFNRCRNIETVVFSRNMDSHNGEFCGCEKLKEVNLPDTLTSIEDDYISMCKSLKEITIPSMVRYFGCDSFFKCDSLESLTILSKVIELEEDDAIQFSELPKLKEIKMYKEVYNKYKEILSLIKDKIMFID